MNNQLKHAFDTVVAEDKLKENTRNYLHYRLYGKYRRRAMYGKLAVAFSLLLLLGFGGHLFYFTPVSFISIDINPSIELGINRLDRIVSVTPFNVDGAAALENLQLKNRKYDEAIVILLDSRGMSSYVTEESQISISVASDYNEQNTEIQERVRACTEDKYENVSCHSSNEGVMESAHHEGVSFGKYQAFLELQSLDADIRLEDVKDLTMRQIQDLIDAFSETTETGDVSSETTGSENAGSGSTDSGMSDYREITGETDRMDCENNEIYGHGHGHSGGKCQN